ncbi:hypothetical protein [Pelagibacterium halotolerans]|uniref:Uncharacterized protein n=1 Tax=Pelagibacterium halotolerans (strain DSM 22347 / JCM 15775 / CGMCC 1.7692 / B2) TaxID=1082931 RepID=G4RE02_PELHB|nr:hypothetical protein [Pelagibacterium halotolerans]AEQ50796.1 hypothetical protein KKY_757 [Pelagibacterium halotolerans B2]QJR19288.1 hypothetical protein HKM20_13070 [Pelagibacterium halotolerans]SDZ96170.1 hypothetical protein SAMN05428936_101684 [Pelagibacterium halotolerans]
MDAIVSTVLAKGDLAHVALFLWAGGASVTVFKLLKELSAANRRFNTFVTEIAHLNKLFRDKD